MSKESSPRQPLLGKIERTLKSRECFAIRFQLENIGIQTFMYSFIAQAILDDRIHATIGDGNHYDDTTNPHTLTLLTADPPGHTIVHEATHAVIDATHKGRKISRGANEAAAFLAEAIYAMYTGESMGGDYPTYFAPPFYRMAAQIHEFNLSHRSGLFVCPQADVANLKTLIGTLPNSYGGVNQKIDTMKGIGDGA